LSIQRVSHKYSSVMTLSYAASTQSSRRCDLRGRRQMVRLIAVLRSLFRDVPEADVAFAMNAGMFDAAGSPIGLDVEDGQRLHTISTADGPGNFHMKPNGVFWVDASGAPHVASTDAFLAASTTPLWATQSGPMLVIDAELSILNSARTGTSRLVRNGVGVGDDGRTWFVISDGPVSFGKLARFFRDELKSVNALYFDGAVSSLWAPSLKRMDAGAVGTDDRSHIPFTVPALNCSRQWAARSVRLSSITCGSVSGKRSDDLVDEGVFAMRVPRCLHVLGHMLVAPEADPEAVDLRVEIAADADPDLACDGILQRKDAVLRRTVRELLEQFLAAGFVDRTLSFLPGYNTRAKSARAQDLAGAGPALARIRVDDGHALSLRCADGTTRSSRNHQAP